MMDIFKKHMEDRKEKYLSTNLKKFISQEKWTFAKTMTLWPHEYIVREKADETLFVELVVHIRTHGYLGKFYQKDITYFEESGMIYWTMGAPIDETIIINRCKKENTYEQRWQERRRR